MRWGLFATGMAATAAAPHSAAAQQSDFSIKQTRRLAYDYAKCVVDHHAAEASQALLANVRNKAIIEQYGSLIQGDCLVRETHANSQMRFSGDLFRYALADALVARELRSSPIPVLDNVPPLERAAEPDPPAPLPANAGKAERRRYEKNIKDFNEDQAFRALAALGECVVRLNPADAKALLLTMPETDAEAAGFGTLTPTVAQCLPEGRTISLGKLVLRGTIAVNYYRLAHGARPVVTP